MDKNSNLTFLFKLLRFLIIVFLLDFSIGNALRYFYFNLDIGRQYRASYSIEETDAEILIFGSSRAYNNFVPDIFEARLNKTCYNTGSAGQFILYDYATLKAILDRYSPKLIFLDVIPGEFQIENNSYERLSFLLPYYYRYTAMQPVIDLKGKYEKYKLVSSIYPFNSTLIVLAGSHTSYYKARNKVEKGYRARTGIWNEPLKTITIASYPLDTTKINVFESFIDDCRKAGTELVVVCSPTFRNVTTDDTTLLAIKKITNQKDVLFLNFTNDPFFLDNPQLFDEPLHLNKKGSEIFTHILIDTLESAGF